MTATCDTLTPFDQLGGEPRVRMIVDRFYDLMDSDPAYAGLRALHAADLAPMRGSLAGFLVGWLGGPRDWFAANPGKCMMSLHGRVGVTPATAAQWTAAMARAITDAAVDAALAARINEAFERMATGMAQARD